MTAQIPSDTHAVSDAGHTTDHNAIAATLSLITGTAPLGIPTTKSAMQAITGAAPTNGQILTGTALGGSAWATPTAAICLPSGDTSGATDTANINTLFADGLNVGLIPGASYWVTQIIPGNQQSLTGGGPTTIIYSAANTAAIYMHAASNNEPHWGQLTNIVSGSLSHFTLDGSNTTGAAVGIDIGDGVLYDVRHLFIRSYVIAGSVGLYINNANFWTERSHFEARIQNCDTCVHMTQSGGVESMEFNVMDFNLQCIGVSTASTPTNQNGVLIDNGAYFSKGSMHVRGNFDTANSAMSNYALKLNGNSGGFYSHISNSRLEILCETDNSRANAPIPVVLGSGNGITNCWGGLCFDDGWSNSTGLTGSNLTFGGVIEGDTTLSSNNTAPTGWA